MRYEKWTTKKEKGKKMKDCKEEKTKTCKFVRKIVDEVIKVEMERESAY